MVNDTGFSDGNALVRGCSNLLPEQWTDGGILAGFIQDFTVDQINKYFALLQMPIISPRYWNIVHGAKPEEVKRDMEGMQTMRILGKNMAYFLKCKEIGVKAGVPLPEPEDITFTNFIRDAPNILDFFTCYKIFRVSLLQHSIALIFLIFEHFLNCRCIPMIITCNSLNPHGLQISLYLTER